MRSAERLDVAVHHRRGRRHAEAVSVAHDSEPVGGLRLLGRDDVADAIDEDLGAAAGNGVEAGVAQPGQRRGDAELRAARDVLDLGRGERVQVDRVALLERAEEVLVVVDPEVGVVAALHEHARAADRESLLDLLEDDRFREQIALGPVSGAAVEGAEVAVGDADVRVVDVAVDDERDPAAVGAARAKLVGRLADRDEVLGLEERQRLVVRDALSLERLVEDLGYARHFSTSLHFVFGDCGPGADLVAVDDRVSLRVQDSGLDVELLDVALRLASRSAERARRRPCRRRR